jgi:hypothetical protein
MMLVTGAVIVPTTSTQLFIALGGILGAGACGVGASLVPSVLWATENAKGISKGITEGIKTGLKPKLRQPVAREVSVAGGAEFEPVIRPMNDDEIQGAGCLFGVLGLGAIALATAPTEAVMLAAGGVGVPSNTPLLMMGMLGTLLPAGCTFGEVASLPLLSAYQSFDTAAIGQKLSSMIGWGRASAASIVQQEDAVDPTPESQGSLPSVTMEEPTLDVLPMRVVRQDPMGDVFPSPPNP